MTTITELARLAAIADKSAPGAWFTLDQPWLQSGTETQVMSGSPDPHVAVPVCDFLDQSMAGTEEAFTEDEWTQRNWACAEYIAAADPQTILGLLRELEQLKIENNVKAELLNTPLFDDFTEAVKREAAHQVQRWGRAHDRSKSAENWYWLVGYLSGKALRSAISGDREKALHHTISSAAALMQWHAAIIADKSGAGVGDDEDLRAKEET